MSTDHHDATVASPELRIGIAELRRRPGNRQHVDRDVTVGQLAISTAAVPAPGTAHIDVVMESLSDGVTVQGTLAVPWRGECRRCLETTSGVARTDLAEVFKDRADEGETHRIDGDTVDLGPAVHDAVILALPLAPLCRPDCPGPDPDAFPVITGDEAAERPTDPRWAALAELRFDSEESESLE